ncbi:MAG: Spy/CpxP family protein refolding chaperone [Prolixibacteraceae bacterium]
MKKLVLIVTTILFMAGYTASAQMMGQNKNQNQQQGMMMQRGGMMQGMMGQQMCPMCGQMMMGQNMPMKKYGMMVNRLPNMQEQLSLSDEQVENLFDLQTEFKKQQIDYQAELRKKQMKLKNLLADNASASQVKNQMEACSETKINMKVAAYETAGEMKALLNSDQKEQMKDHMMQGGMMNQGRGGMMQNRGGMMQNQDNQ